MTNKAHTPNPVIEKLLRDVCVEIKEVQSLQTHVTSQEMVSRLNDLQKKLRYNMKVYMDLWLIDAPLEIEQLFTEKFEPFRGILNGIETTIGGYIVAEIDNLVFSKKTDDSRSIQFASYDFSDEKMNKIIESTRGLLRSVVSGMGTVLLSCSELSPEFPSHFVIEKRPL